MTWLREPLLWLVLLFVALLVAMPYSAPLFSALFPELPRPVYQQESFVSLTLGPLLAGRDLKPGGDCAGAGAGIAVTRPAGREFRPLVETIARSGRPFRRWRCWRLRCR
ncbi:Putative osmoprotectant uptake system permease protein yehW [Leclercia adecarboxylata]|uniref:Osmoprotectant uptake system permease protein yehW n=1 Tax=Leclercia adecarboxylata TaxID=83655 RepID=A0A4U9I513_9ENTR|nr:Putative osmoprotectant uptake system permease protein yehW [Leclercia adecarboxylata]